MIRLIAAIDRRRGLAKQGIQPWYIPEDEQRFSELTKQYNGHVLVGSTTFNTFRGPLVDRDNYVLTRDKTPIKGVELVHDLKKFLAEFKNRDLWVIGGANVFAEVMELGRADELHLTHIDADFNCNQFFPEYAADFKLQQRTDKREQNGFNYTYAWYTRAA